MPTNVPATSTSPATLALCPSGPVSHSTMNGHHAL